MVNKETQTVFSDTHDKDPNKHYKHVGHLSSSVNGRHVIILDDMIDTGHTMDVALRVRKLCYKRYKEIFQCIWQYKVKG